MTTIACDGRTIASDTLGTVGDQRVSTPRQKVVIEGGHIYGFTGDYAFFEAARQWHTAGADPDKIPKASAQGGWTLLVFRAHDMATYHNDVPYPSFYEYPQAFGSGESYALGAMKVKATAGDAVQAAIDIDTKSGGQVRTLDLEDALRKAEAQRVALQQPQAAHVTLTDGKQFLRVPTSNGMAIGDDLTLHESPPNVLPPGG